MSNNLKLRTYTKKERNVYLIGLAGQNVLYNVINMLLASYFLQNVLYIPAMTVGFIITGARVWDAFNDFLMGTVVDKTKSKWGKCRPYLLFIPLPICIITILNFVNGTYDSTAGLNFSNIMIVAWAAFIYVLWGMTYTIGDIPLWGITSRMTEIKKDREKLVSLAKMFAGIGAAIATVALQPLALAVSKTLTEKFGDFEKGSKYGFLLVAAGFTIIAAGAYQLVGVFVKENIKVESTGNKVRDNFKMMWGNKPFRQILISGVIAGPKNILMLVAFPIITYYYSSKDPGKALFYMAFLGGGLFIGNFVSMALVPKLLTKFSKKNLYNYSNIIAGIPCGLLFFVYLTGPDKMTTPLYMAFSFIGFLFNGIALGITNVLQAYMIADAIDYEEYTNNRRPDGVFFAGQTFIAKLGAGVSSIIYAVACSVVGFSSANIKALDAAMAEGLIPREVMMTDSTIYGYLTMMFFVITVPVAISSLLCVIPTWKYALDDKKHDEILEELNKRRHASEEKDETAQ